MQLTKEEIKNILFDYENHRFKDEIIYYVHEYSIPEEKMGYFTNKFIVGVHNKHTHFRIDKLKKYLMEREIEL